MQTNVPISPSVIQNLAQHIASLQKRVTELETKQETGSDRLVELAKASKDRFDRIQSLLSHFEMAFKKNSQDMHLELSKITGQLTQKRVIDIKIQDLVQKHNQMVCQFEQRLQELKKGISAQQMKLLELESRLKVSESIRL